MAQSAKRGHVGKGTWGHGAHTNWPVDKLTRGQEGEAGLKGGSIRRPEICGGAFEDTRTGGHEGMREARRLSESRTGRW